jgi:hypothetical protein
LLQHPYGASVAITRSFEDKLKGLAAGKTSLNNPKQYENRQV